MKTRILQTKFWADDFVSSLTPLEKLIFNYYLTNERVNIIHCYECPDKYVLIDTGVSRGVLERAKTKFEANNKIRFYKSYVLLINAYKYESYRGKDNEKAKQNLLDEMSPDVLDWYNNKNNTPVERRVESSGIPLPINHKSEIINHKPEDTGVVKGGEMTLEYLHEIPKEDILEFCEKLGVTEKQVVEKAVDLWHYCKAHGKKYRDYKAFLRNALKKDFAENSKKEVKAVDAAEILYSENRRTGNSFDPAGVPVSKETIPKRQDASLV